MNKPLPLLAIVFAVGACLFAVRFSSSSDARLATDRLAITQESKMGKGVDYLVIPSPEEDNRAVSLVTAERPIAADVASLNETPLDVAKREISEQVDVSLDGILEINRLIDQLALIADLPISKTVDYSFEDNDAVAYEILGTPDGMEAHFLVGLRPYERDGKSFKTYELEVQIGGDEVTFVRGAMREGPRVRMVVDFDEDGNVGMMGLIATRRVSLGLSRQAGINAYEGEFVSGISYKGSMTNPEQNMSETFGTQNGHVVTSTTSPAYLGSIKPLLGDLMIDPEKAQTLFGKLQNRFASLDNKN